MSSALTLTRVFKRLARNEVEAADSVTRSEERFAGLSCFEFGQFGAMIRASNFTMTDPQAGEHALQETRLSCNRLIANQVGCH